MTDEHPDDTTEGSERTDDPDGDERRETGGHDADESGDGAPDRSRAARAAAYLQWTAVGVLSLLAVVAALRFYFNVSGAISLWVAPEYESFYQAAFNLVVVLVSVSAVSLLLSRMGEE